MLAIILTFFPHNPRQWACISWWFLWRTLFLFNCVFCFPSQVKSSNSEEHVPLCYPEVLLCVEIYHKKNNSMKVLQNIVYRDYWCFNFVLTRALSLLVFQLPVNFLFFKFILFGLRLYFCEIESNLDGILLCLHTCGWLHL